MAQRIRIKIDTRYFEFPSESQEEEEMIRKAAKDINEMIGRYQMEFPGKNILDILSLVVLNIGKCKVELQDKIERMKLDEYKLQKDIEGYLDNIEN